MSSQPLNSPESRPIRSRFSSDPEMVELVKLFVEEMPDRIGAIEAAFREGQRDVLKTLTHQLKGASGGYGFDQIGSAAGVVEQAVRSLPNEESLEKARREVDALIEVCRRAIV